MNSYFRLRLMHVPSSLEEEITILSFDSKCLGISEVLSYVQKDLVYDPTLRPQKFKDMDIYFDQRPPQTLFEKIAAINGNIKWEIFEEAHKDWLEEWKKGFKPFCLVGPYWVVPSWEKAPPEAAIPLWIDPGMAFGTGTHATTQLAAALVYKWFQKPPFAKPIEVIDIGTGTAILAMLARYAGADDVMAIDIDPEARRVARENVQLNTKVDQVIVSDVLIEEIRGSFHLVIANIIDGVLLNIKKDMLRVLKPGGHMIVTGILEERETQFIDDFLKDTTLKIERRIAKDEWVGYWLSQSL